MPVCQTPKLNPVENIWQDLRQNQLSNRVFESYDAIVDACSEAWNALTTEKAPNRMTLAEAPQTETECSWAPFEQR